MKINKVNGRRVELNMTINEFCEKSGFDTATYYRKIKNDGADFTLKQVIAMSETLGLTSQEINDFFLSN